MSDKNMDIDSESDKPRTFGWEDFRNMKVPVSLFSLVISAFFAIGATLFVTGAFTPDTDLTKSMGVLESKYDSKSKEYDVLNLRIKSLHEENVTLREAVESDRIKSEERISIRQLELENDRLVQVSNVESRTRIAEVEAEEAISERDTQTRQIESFNSVRAQILLACIKLKSASAQRYGLEDETDYIMGCSMGYEEAMPEYEQKLMNPDRASFDPYSDLRTLTIFKCIESKGGWALDYEGEGALDALQLLAANINECGTNFDAKMSNHEAELRKLLENGNFTLDLMHH